MCDWLLIGCDARLAAIEQEAMGAEQEGSLLIRMSQIENELLGEKQAGALPARLDTLEAMLA